jgi:hypothetical protein
MEKITEFLNRRVSKLQNRIEGLLSDTSLATRDFDRDLEKPVAKDESWNFEVTRDLRPLRDLCRQMPDDFEDQILSIFAALHPYFDGGLLLEHENESWQCRLRFCEGHFDRGVEAYSAHWPQLSPNGHFVLEAKTVVAECRLPLANPERTTALVLQPSPDYAFILFSRLPHLWLRDHLQDVKEIINRALG